MRSFFAKRQNLQTVVYFAVSAFGAGTLGDSREISFHKHAQAEGETVAEFIAELRRMVARCSFDDTVRNDMICDRFVCGLKSEPIQKQLLTEDKLTLKRTLELDIAMEAADTSTKTFKATEASSISKLVKTTAVKPKSSQFLPAFHRCGKRNHVSKNCRFKNKRCHRCGKIGHIAPV